MGWCSATSIFDTAMTAVYKFNIAVDSDPSPESQRTALIEFAKHMRDVLEEQDWDCQGESDYYDDLKKDLWPEAYREEIADLYRYGTVQEIREWEAENGNHR